MPYEIMFDKIPAGYSMSAARDGQKVSVRMREFTSSEDGDAFISRLEGLPTVILSRLPVMVEPSTVDHLLTVIRRDKTATVYVNELAIEGTMRPRYSLKKGESILQRDVLSIERMHITNVTIPEDAGIVLLLSFGWRKGLYFDLVPLHDPTRPKRDYDLELLCGQFWTYLVFQDMFKINEATWQHLFCQRWFPFIYLGYPLIKKMVDHACNGWDVDELLPEISREVTEVLESATGVWRNNPYFSAHVGLIERAVDRFKQGDHVSASSILYPRIEGVMRSYFNSAGVATKPTAANLVREVIEKDDQKRHSCCMFLPDRFHRYLDEIYFAHFTPGSGPEVGRHSVAHGEARVDDFNLKASAIGFLTLYQLALFLTPETRKEENKC